MRRYGGLFFFYTGAVIVFLVSVVFTIRTIGAMPAQAARLSERSQTMLRLDDMKNTRAERESAVHFFDGLPKGLPVSLRLLAESDLVSAKSEVRERDTIELSNGWVLKRFEVVCEDLRFDSMSAFLRSAESSSPPWRLVDAYITASRVDGGFGRAAFVMEALERKDDGGSR